jgi:tRNA(Ile)-lysidine synthase
MANSRKSKLNPSASKRIAVALSGGLDSVVLLDTVCKAASQGQDAAKEIWVFHIHHGLQKDADQWLVFCEKLAKKYQVHFDFRLLHFQNQAVSNIEARARAGRYEALTELCVEHGIEDLLLAHHQNDQAETVLLQLMRGSGVAGLSAMPQERISTINGCSISLWRPLLAQSKVDLEAYAKLHKLKWIEDPSNQSTVFRRNAIRKQIIPRLEKIQPEAVANLARSAELLAQSQKLLDRLAIQDGKDIFTCQSLQLSTLLSLADRDLPAANNVMRYWLKSNGLFMPSQERLDAWWQDLWGVKPQAHLEWIHDGASIRLWRGLLQLVQIGAGQWIWVEISPNSKKPGLSAAWVQEAQLAGQIEQRERLGGEKIQIKPNAPRKTLKNLFQEGNIPPWERQAPLLFINKELIAVAGVGVSYSHLTTAGKRVLPEWSYQQ